MDNKDFIEQLRAMLSIDEDKIHSIIERLDMDGLIALIDAVLANDEEAVKKTIKSHMAEGKKLPPSKAPQPPKVRSFNRNFKPKVEQSQAEKDAKRDGWDRRAKHPRRDIEEAEVMFSLGDEVIVDENQEGTIKIPQGPNRTIGVLVDGKLRMVDQRKVKVKPISEGMTDLNGVIGFNTMQTINRMQALAGISKPEPEVEVEVVAEPVPVVQSTVFCAIDAVETALCDLKMSEFKAVVERLRAILTAVEEFGRATISEAFEAEPEPMDLGKTRADAVNALQQQLGGKPQNRLDAQKAFDQGRKDGSIVQKNGSFQAAPKK